MARAGRVCGRSGCPLDVRARGLCEEHGREADQARGTRTERGYGSEHQSTRARLLAAHVEGSPCRRCGLPMWRSQGLNAAHTIPLRLNPNARADHLEHAACNRGDTK